MQPQHNIGPMSAAQYRALIAILEEFRGERLTPAIMILANRLARLEAAK